MSIIRFLILLSSNSTDKFIYQFPGYISKHTEIDVNKLANAKNYEEFLNATQSSQFYDILKQFSPDEKNRLPISDIENKLYNLVFGKLTKLIKATTKGQECGSTFGANRSLYQGLFLAPHTTAQAVKTAVFAARMMELLGYRTEPTSDTVRHDIIQMIHFGAPEPLKKFCKGIQFGAPVDSFVTPEPWDMPGYDCPVIMAAGAFIQGASIELSCDAPMREPYTAYLQGGLTYESGKAGVLLAVEELLRGE